MLVYSLTCKNYEVSMEYFTTTLLSGLLYDAFKEQVFISSNFLKSKLQGWIFDDDQLEKLATKINTLDLHDYSEKRIEKELNGSEELQNILHQIKPEKSTIIGSVKQKHNGSGDNIVGNKTVYQGR